MPRGALLVDVVEPYAPESFPASSAVPTVNVLSALALYHDLENYAPRLGEIAKWNSPHYQIPDYALVIRPRFDPKKFVIAVPVWRNGSSYLTQDLILGSSGDGSVRYFSGLGWPGMPTDNPYLADILDLGELAWQSGDFDPFEREGKIYLGAHRVYDPVASMFASEGWREIEAARTRATLAMAGGSALPSVP